MTTASAPGKVILFGEHAVVYNRPALAVPVTQVHADVEISDAHRDGIWFDAPNIGLKADLDSLSPQHPLRIAVEIVLEHLSVPQKTHNLDIRINSTIPVASGLGSGAAVSVALIRALAQHVGAPLQDEQINLLAYEIEKIHHGTPSGIDNTVITYSRPVYFRKTRPIETLNVLSAFTIVIGGTGITAPTRESVGDVRRLWQAEPLRWEQVFDQVETIVQQARGYIEGGEWIKLGALMNANHAILQSMSVSCRELDQLVAAACAAGAEGAKLSGGGRGGNMIALVRPENAHQVASALRTSGATQTIITTIQ